MGWLTGRFRYAWQGFRHGIVQDRSICLQLVLGLAVIAVSCFLGLSVSEWLWVLLAVTLVITAEVFNSCLEKTVDYISLARDPRAKQIKDMAAAAVSLVCLFAAGCGLVILLPKVIKVFL